jgi:hypothetical protein
VFGGGLALYNCQGNIMGALGVSGDTSCADHAIAWRCVFVCLGSCFCFFVCLTFSYFFSLLNFFQQKKNRVRHSLNMDFVPNGPSEQSNDNIIYDDTNGFSQSHCLDENIENVVRAGLPATKQGKINNSKGKNEEKDITKKILNKQINKEKIRNLINK